MGGMNLMGESLGTCRTFACTIVCGAQPDSWALSIHLAQPDAAEPPVHREVSGPQHADGGSSPGQVPP